MADCNDTLRELEAILDHELDEHVSAGIHEHLQGCTDCHQALDFHAELRQVVREKCRNDELPPDLVARLEQCLQEDFDGDGQIG